MLSRDEILAVNDFETKEVDVWGGKVRIRSMSDGDLMKYVDTIKDGQSLVDSKARLAVLSVVDDNDKPIFTDKDVPALMQKSAGSLNVLSDAILALNKLSEKDVEGAVKN